jgi:hypothetical protein
LGELELYAYHTRLKIDQQKQSSYNFIKKNWANCQKKIFFFKLSKNFFWERSCIT